MLFFVYFSILTCAVQAQVETKIVDLNQGSVRGYKDAKYDVFAFLGVPYAEEPKGRDRFKAPLPPPTWDNILNATNSNSCPQFLTSMFSLPDNCLVANIYVPKTDAVNLPVLIFIHGGGFSMGAGHWSHPNSLVNSKRIVAVTINYRLGVHGFLCLGTENAPGNAGMKDQVAALRWVKENIAKFGGNPNAITIAGSSAGSISVNFHLLSKMSRGLFQRLIPDSAADVSPFSPQQNPIEDAKKFAGSISSDLDVDDRNALENFYLETPLIELVKHAYDIQQDYSLIFSPCVERNTGTERFLEASPYSIIKSGDYPKLPKLEGFSNMEGLLVENKFDIYSPEMNKDFASFLPADLQFESMEQKDEVARTVKQFYFGNKEVGPETALHYYEYFSDIGFNYPILRSIKLHLEAGMETYYLYEYAFVDDKTPYIPYTNIRGANHAAQTGAIYDGFFGGLFSNDTKEFEKMKETWQELYLNFITDGQPVLETTKSVPAWPKVQKFNSPYMLLNQTSSLKSSLMQRRFDFWDGIYEKHYSEPKPPSNRGYSYRYPAVLTFVHSILILMFRI